MLKYGISVDWDYFVPENRAWDMSHAESPMYMDILWQTRLALMDEMKVVDEAKTFWTWVQSWCSLDVTDVWVSESHGAAIIDPELRNVDVLVLFDQHHDCWPHKGRNTDHIFCDTWVRGWLENDDTRKVIWVRPDYQPPYINPERSFSLPKDLKRRFTCVNRPDFNAQVLGLQDVKVSAVNICRSGAWTPPWLDPQFLDFVASSQLTALDLDMLVHTNPQFRGLSVRWSPEYFKTILEAYEPRRKWFEQKNTELIVEDAHDR